MESRVESETESIIAQLNVSQDNPRLASAQHFADELLGLKLQLSSIKEVTAALADVAGETEILSDVRVRTKRSRRTLP